MVQPRLAPNSTHIDEEGVLFDGFVLMKGARPHGFGYRGNVLNLPKEMQKTLLPMRPL